VLRLHRQRTFKDLRRYLPTRKLRHPISIVHYPFLKYVYFCRYAISQKGHAEEIARIRATNEFLVEELNQLRLASSEATQLKQQNTELRAKVIRQDAAWKRKIESERRRGHIVDFGKTGKSLPLGNCSDSANIALNREDRPKSKDSVRASRRGDESKSGQMARSQDLENADGKAWL